jgi:hypothetical protein
MPEASRARLPDSDAARRAIDEAVSLLGPRIAARAHAQAEAVRLFLERGNLRWHKKEAADLILNIRWAWGVWVGILAGFLPSRDGELLRNALLPRGRVEGTGLGDSRTLIPAGAATLAAHRRLHVKVREESQVRVGERADDQAPVEKPVELLAACLGRSRASSGGTDPTA